MPFNPTQLKGFKTVLFNVMIANATVLFGPDVVDALNQLSLTTDQAYAVIVALIASVNILIRAVTDSPIFKKTVEVPPSA